MSAYGFHQSDWNLAKQEARSVLIERAKVRGFIHTRILRKRFALFISTITIQGFSISSANYLQKRTLRGGVCSAS